MGLYGDSHAGDGSLAAAVDTMIIKAGVFCGPVNIIAERRRYIMDVARCRSCGMSGKECDRIRRTRRDGTVGCCISDFLQECRHDEDRHMVNQLMREIMAGEVRTVAEAYPPPVQGPRLPSYDWLLSQDVWWYPHRRPAVRIAEMDKPHRFNTAQWLERRAADLHDSGLRYMHNAPDEVWASWEAENTHEWLREKPLMKALRKGLPPPESRKGRQLAERAVHWHTCPMRHAHPDRFDRCLCLREGSGGFGRVIGASNDPTSPPMRTEITS